jgi:hypothetical protein
MENQDGQSDHMVSIVTSDIIGYDSYRTVHRQSHLGTCTQFVDSKQATPTTFDPCLPAGIQDFLQGEVQIQKIMSCHQKYSNNGHNVAKKAKR